MEPQKHEAAWRIPSGTSSVREYGVLVRCGSPGSHYWWLLCPATATLYIPDIHGKVNARSCANGMECDWPDVHQFADDLVRRLSR